MQASPYPNRGATAVGRSPESVDKFRIIRVRGTYYSISHENIHDADGPQAYRMKMGGDFHIKCLNGHQYEEILNVAFSWFGCERPVHVCFNRACYEPLAHR